MSRKGGGDGGGEVSVGEIGEGVCGWEGGGEGGGGLVGAEDVCCCEEGAGLGAVEGEEIELMETGWMAGSLWFVEMSRIVIGASASVCSSSRTEAVPILVAQPVET